MKLRTTIATIAGTGLSAMLRVIGVGAMAVLACAAISACSGSTPPAASASPSLSDAAGASPGSTVSLPANESGTPSVTPTTPTASPSPTPTLTVTTTATPTAAPATGGGGTAGIQDATLFIIGGAAIVVGAGGIAYRRRITRSR
jgi:hypothetical protein